MDLRVEHTDLTGEAMIERIRALAHQLNLDPAALLGAAMPARKLIEAQPVAAEPAPIEGAS
jgi:hypothetical protein